MENWALVEEMIGGLWGSTVSACCGMVVVEFVFVLICKIKDGRKDLNLKSHRYGILNTINMVVGDGRKWLIAGLIKNYR